MSDTRKNRYFHPCIPRLNFKQFFKAVIRKFFANNAYLLSDYKSTGFWFKSTQASQGRLYWDHTFQNQLVSYTSKEACLLANLIIKLCKYLFKNLKKHEIPDIRLYLAKFDKILPAKITIQK